MNNLDCCVGGLTYEKNETSKCSSDILGTDSFN
jgi:hypothetical protein